MERAREREDVMETVSLEGAQTEKVEAAVAECPLFRALKPALIPQLLKVAETVRYQPEEIVLRQGDPSDSFLVVVEGEGAIRVESPSGEVAELGRIPRPSSLGEIGLLLGEPRTATVVAASPLTALRFSAKAFEAMFEKIPNFGEALAAGLAHRLEKVSGQVPLPGRDLEEHPPTREALELLPVELCKRHRVLPLSVKGNVLTLGHVDDPSSQVMSAVREHAPSFEMESVHVDLAAFNAIMRTRAGAQGWARPEGAPAPAPVPSPRSPRLDALLEKMVAEGASDLHLAAAHKPHWRVDGDMAVIEDGPVLGPDDAFDLLRPVTDQRHRDEFAKANDVDFAYSIPGVARFRVNLFRDHHGTGAVFRLIPSRVLTLEQLGLPPVLKNFCEMPKGLVLVTGPTGSGKSSTLAAMIDFIKKTRRTHIVTIEDPIEFVHDSGVSLITQREVGGHTTSFARALKAALREDPDIILVGEMRDLETIALALEAANTGHLVLATLHTNSAIGAVDRIVDMFPGDQQPQVRTALSEVLRGVVAQTLCKKTDGGRMAVLEVLVVNMAAANLIREDKTVQITSIMQANKAIGMSTLNDELGSLIEARKITMEEGLSKAVDKDDLLRRFRSGVTVSGDPSRGFRVQAVKPGSPGADAGIQRGDAILEVGGIPGKDHTLDELRRILRSDGQHQLVVERGGKRVKLVLELRR
jgi:twitching motility protein PilT